MVALKSFQPRTVNKLKKKIKTALRSVLARPIFSKLRTLTIPDDYIWFSGGWLSPVKFNEDGMATAHNADFLKSKQFIKAYEAGCATESWGPIGRTHLRWRVFNACTLSKYAMRVPGDFVECGTNRGGNAAAIMSYNEFENSDKKFFLLDTFSGFDFTMLTAKEENSVDVEAYKKRFQDCYEDVKKYFSSQPSVKVIKGSVPSTLSQIDSEKIAFLHLDMNCSAPERAAIEYLWDRITPGGVVLLDDYAWDEHEEQKQSLDEFAASKGIEVVGMATGQGLIIKPYW